MAWLLSLLMAATPTVAACPATGGGVPLSTVTVFDGPPEELASLVPDSSRTTKGVQVTTWSVRYIYRAGRKAYLRCAYDKAPPQTIEIARPVNLCRYTVKGGVRAIACK